MASSDLVAEVVVAEAVGVDMSANNNQTTRMATTSPRLLPVTKSTKRDQELTRTARTAQLRTVAMEAKEVVGAEVAEAAAVSKTGKARDPCDSKITTRDNRITWLAMRRK